jgi:hypothetical protein
MQKKKRKKEGWFIEVIGDPTATKSEAARKSMELLAAQILKYKNLKK